MSRRASGTITSLPAPHIVTGTQPTFSRILFERTRVPMKTGQIQSSAADIPSGRSPVAELASNLCHSYQGKRYHFHLFLHHRPLHQDIKSRVRVFRWPLAVSDGVTSRG